MPYLYRALLALLLGAASLIGLAAPPAGAVGPPVIVSPASGATVAGDFKGPIRVDFSNLDVAQHWTLSVTSTDGCSAPPAGQRCSGTVGVVAEPDWGPVDLYLPQPLTVRTDYTVTLASTGQTPVTSSFTLADGTPPADPGPAPSADVVRINGGDPVVVGDAPRFTVDFAARPAAYPYDVTVIGAGSEYWELTTYAAGRTTVALSTPLTDPGQAWVSISDGVTGQHLESRYFEVRPEPAGLEIRRVRPSTFYPTVRDGFKDSVDVTYWVSERADMSYVVRDRDGRKVAARSLGSRGGGVHSFRWNGRDDDGEPVDPDRYRIEVRADNGSITTARTTVTATSDVVSRRGYKEVRGTDTSRRAKRGNCFIRGYSGELTLDCWGGAFAHADYGFSVPSNAKNLRYEVRGSQGCCDRGRIDFSGRRVSARRYTVGVHVTYWRAYTVRKVELRYTYQVRR